jgi:hypothetical protein
VRKQLFYRETVLVFCVGKLIAIKIFQILLTIFFFYHYFVCKVFKFSIFTYFEKTKLFMRFSFMERNNFMLWSPCRHSWRIHIFVNCNKFRNYLKHYSLVTVNLFVVPMQNHFELGTYISNVNKFESWFFLLHIHEGETS